MTTGKCTTKNLCPKCGADRDTLKSCLDQPYHAPAAQQAMWLIDDCRACKSYFVAAKYMAEVAQA